LHNPTASTGVLGTAPLAQPRLHSHRARTGRQRDRERARERERERARARERERASERARERARERGVNKEIKDF